MQLLVVALLMASAAAADKALTSAVAASASRTSASGAVAAGLAGQFRKVIAGAIWVKADAYHHEFIKHNRHWTSNHELIPMMRAVTTLDPSFTEAYASGAWMMALYQKKPDDAKAYLREGIRNNPGSSGLYETMAVIHWKCDKDIRASLADLKQARRFAPTRWDAERLDRSIRKILSQLSEKSGSSPASNRSS